MMKHRVFFALQVVFSAMMGFWGPAHAQNPPPTWDQILPADDPGGPCPSNSSRFTCVMSGAAVRDNETGLVWEQSPSTSTFPWHYVSGTSTAAVHCLQLNVGNRKGWRLPTIQELMSLVDGDPANTSIPRLPPGHPFSNVNSSDYSSRYWSATTVATQPDYAWHVNFSFANAGGFDKGALFFAWCVRGGRGGDPQ
jgi:hypothetical protein